MDGDEDTWHCTDDIQSSRMHKYHTV